jgi:hypothetical protein
MSNANVLKREPARISNPKSSLAKRSRVHALAERLLRDRAERAARKPARNSTIARVERVEFDPFKPMRWCVIAGGNQGYLVKTPMRRGPVGWFIACSHCGARFESTGWKYCPTCMELPAEERRVSKPASSGPPCQAPSCNAAIPRRRRADAKYCSDKCAKAAENARAYRGSAQLKFRGDTRGITQRNQGPKNALMGPADWPTHLIGGDRRGGKIDPEVRCLIINTEIGRHP